MPVAPWTATCLWCSSARPARARNCSRALHITGPRSDHPFIAMNCAALPESLIEGELFGYGDGAFTGAKRGGAAGKIESADGGTLFLDEIGDMPLSLQTRLLRILQERAVVRLGESRERPLDVALVCATNQDLRDLVARRLFREDLYYRINGLRVTLPPLRERTISCSWPNISCRTRNGSSVGSCCRRRQRRSSCTILGPVTYASWIMR